MLRYKGKPFVGTNKQVDKLDPLCLCHFVAVNVPLDGRQCPVHGNRVFGCDRCACTNYKPNKAKEAPVHWPICTCGHIAQDHNNTWGN